MTRIRLFAAMTLVAALPTTGFSNEFEGAIRDIAQSELVGWTSNAQVVDAIRAQNAAHAGLTQAQIDEMDSAWRTQVGSDSAALIDEVLGRPGSEWLRTQKDAAGGLISEVFVMDAHGLNVLASDTTSDYWQGDEAKFQETFPKGPGAMHISEVEFDESSQTYQSQVSMAIADPDSNEVIGAITFGINLEMLN